MSGKDPSRHGGSMKPQPDWHGSASKKMPVVDSWCLAYKIGMVAVVIGVVVLVVATCLAMWAFGLQKEGQVLPQWMPILAGMGWGEWHARNSGLGEVAELYYTCILPLFPASIVATYVFLTYEKDGSLKDWITCHRDAKGIVAVFFIIFLFPLIGIVFLKLFGGGDTRLLHISEEPSALLLRGWIPFVALGGVTALGPWALRALIFQYVR